MAKKLKAPKRVGNNGARRGAGNVQLNVEVGEQVPAYYANFFEVTHSKFDFVLIAARIPAKPSVATRAEIQQTGTVTFPAEFTVSIAPALVPALIRALTIQKASYEEKMGTELKEAE